MAHSGPVTRGSFVQTLVVTDIASGWTELAPLLVREQTLLVDVLGEIRRRLPFPLLGFDTDNHRLHERDGARLLRGGEDRVHAVPAVSQNDQAHVEQKNGEIVRRMVGYRRYEGLAAAAQLAKLYSPARLFVNAFQPCFKLAEKTRDGAQVKKRYHKPLTPCDRLLADARGRHVARAPSSSRRPTGASVGREPRRAKALVARADTADEAWGAAARAEPSAARDSCGAGLRTAWQDGEVRPTSQSKPRAKRAAVEDPRAGGLPLRPRLPHRRA